MSEEVNDGQTTEAIETATDTSPSPINLDQKVQVGGEEMSLSEIAQMQSRSTQLEEAYEELADFRNSTMRLMDPSTDTDTRKSDLRNVLHSSGYSDSQVEEYIKVYDNQGTAPQMSNENNPTPPPAPMEDHSAREQNARLQEQVSQMRARALNDSLEKEVSSAITGEEKGKVLTDWMKSNHDAESLGAATSSLEQRVRGKALENLRARRNQAGTFEESWVSEEVKKAAADVAQDMLTVIGDPSKIGRVTETEGQGEPLYRRKPVELPSNEGKTFGEVEAQLRDWTSDQILRSLADSGGDSKL